MAGRGDSPTCRSLGCEFQPATGAVVMTRGRTIDRGHLLGAREYRDGPEGLPCVLGAPGALLGDFHPEAGLAVAVANLTFLPR